MARNFSRLNIRPNLRFYQKVRAYFGLTQDNLALFLGIPRASLSLAELDRWSLPHQADVRMRPFLQQVWDAQQDASAPVAAAPAPPAAPPAPDVQKELLWRQRVCQYEAGQLRRKLTVQQTKLAQAERCLLVVPALRAAVADTLTDPDSLESHWLKWFEGQARTTINKHNAGATALLELRIAVLEFEAAQAGQRAGALPAAPPA